jgi:purine-binding chemotaxis protein CheW
LGNGAVIQDAELQVLVFDVGAQRCAVPATAVMRVVRAAAVAALPGGPDLVDGVINVHGLLMPVVDLRPRFGLARSELSAREHFIIVSTSRRHVAVRADRASELAVVRARDLDDARTAIPDVDRVAGVAKLPDGLVVILDLETLLSGAEAAALDRALSPTHP